MTDYAIIAGVALALVAALVFGVKLFFSVMKRIEDLKKLAGRLGFRFRAEASGMLRRYRHLDLLSLGPDRDAYNSMRGRVGEFHVRLFDFRHGKRSGGSAGPSTSRRSRMTTVSVLLIDMPRSYPKLVVGPESALGRLGKLAGIEDVEVGDPEFDRAYRVKARNEEFAREVLNPEAAEVLLRSGGLCLEVARSSVLFHMDCVLTAEGAEELLRTGLEFMRRVPKFEFEERADAAPEEAKGTRAG
ncbi:MAG: hypothetical protein ACYS9X_14145 [Planctomycetota bacterium]|jgi:hypothetical protein